MLFTALNTTLTQYTLVLWSLTQVFSKPCPQCFPQVSQPVTKVTSDSSWWTIQSLRLNKAVADGCPSVWNEGNLGNTVLRGPKRASLFGVWRIQSKRYGSELYRRNFCRLL